MSNVRKRVYQVFDPAPLGSDQTDLYVDLDDVRGSTGIVQKLADAIRLASGPTCQILAGHRGSGKSTELHKLQRQLEQGGERFFVVFCQSDDDIDRNDVDFPEVLIAVVRQMAAQLKKRAETSLKPGVLKTAFERIKGLPGSIELEGIEIGAELFKISATIKGSPETRTEVRKALEPHTGSLLEAANDVIGQAALELQKKGFRGLVILVDDLDKMVLRPHPTAGCSTGVHLFVNREAQLSGFESHMVYTMPLALAYSGQEQTIANLYGGHVPVLPMTKIRQRPPDGQPDAEGTARFRDLIAKRLVSINVKASEVFQGDDVRDRLIALSGGQPRELMILIREAIVGGELPIDMGAVDRAAREGRRAYARQLRAEHWPIIEQVRQTGSITRTQENDELVRDLLDSRAILQYVNDKEWYADNPVIAELKAPPSP